MVMRATGDIHREQSSPGNLQVGQVPSNWTRQMPHTSSSGMSQRHEATAFHSLMVTFIPSREIERVLGCGKRVSERVALDCRLQSRCCLHCSLTQAMVFTRTAAASLSASAHPRLPISTFTTTSRASLLSLFQPARALCDM